MTQVMDERLKRWRLILGGQEAEGTGMSLTGDAAATLFLREDATVAQGRQRRNFVWNSSRPLRSLRIFARNPAAESRVQ